MDAIVNPPEITINGHKLPDFHASLVVAAIKDFTHRMETTRNFLGDGKQTDALRIKSLGGLRQINSLYLS